VGKKALSLGGVTKNVVEHYPSRHFRRRGEKARPKRPPVAVIVSFPCEEMYEPVTTKGRPDTLKPACYGTWKSFAREC